MYGTDVREALLKMKDSKDRMAWILMERIFPPISTGYVVRPCGVKPPEQADLVSEFGIFGTILG